MARLSRYRIGEEDIDNAISELVEMAKGREINTDLVQEMITSSIRMLRESNDRGDLKIANAALKEMRYSFNVFESYRGQKKASIFGSARTPEDHPLYELTRKLGAGLAKEDWMVITGAGPGIMTAGIEGAGSEMSFGVGIKLPFESTTSQFISGDPKLVNFRYFFTRKLMFMKESSGFILMPGGFGTMDEGFELLTLMQTGKMMSTPVVFLDEPNGTYWERFDEFIRGTLIQDNYVGENDLNLYLLAKTAEEAIEELKHFYANYLSQRFVDGIMVLRMKRPISDTALSSINREFSDIITRGEIERCEISKDELADKDNLNSHRLRFNFDKRHWASLRQIINQINDF
ncbi:MAG: TIGR00730 family Rossman fold protein [Acidimicrobiia bacterium]|nr:TIGR00730 family Rossman fold protein [Acidimicrobiia bacterium]